MKILPRFESQWRQRRLIEFLITQRGASQKKCSSKLPVRWVRWNKNVKLKMLSSAEDLDHQLFSSFKLSFLLVYHFCGQREKNGYERHIQAETEKRTKPRMIWYEISFLNYSQHISSLTPSFVLNRNSDFFRVVKESEIQQVDSTNRWKFRVFLVVDKSTLMS